MRHDLRISIVTVSMLVTGCMVGDPTMPTEDDLPPLRSEAALSNNPRTAFNFFVSKGFTDVQAAGIVGNLMQESSVNPTAVEPGGAGRGIAQWGVGGRFDRGTNSLTSFATRSGGSKWSLQTQLDFAWYELATVGGYGLTELRQAWTLNDAVSVFQDKFEICGACATGRRVQYAQDALDQFGGGGGPTNSEDPPPDPDPGTGTTTPPPPPPSYVTCYSGTLQQDMPENTCVESVFDGLWYQCAQGQWVDRWSDPDACNGEYPLY